MCFEPWYIGDMSEDQGEIERSVRVAQERGALDEAVTIVLRGYGPEILRLLRALSKSDDDTSEAFSVFAENLWKGIGTFAWRSTMRTWAYTLARHALLHVQTSPHRRAGRQVPLSDSPVSRMVVDVRERTLPHLRTEVKDGLTRIREELTPDEQLLLILRIDRQMAWDEITAVVDANEDESVRSDTKKRAALHRKRFQLIKDRLKKRAIELGLLGEQES